MLICSAQEYERTAAAAPPSRPLRRGDVAGVMKAIRRDYGREYFVTGVLTDAIYDDNCRFADPTVSFQGAHWHHFCGCSLLGNDLHFERWVFFVHKAASTW